MMLFFIAMVTDQADVNRDKKHKNQSLDNADKNFEHVKRNWYNNH